MGQRTKSGVLVQDDGAAAADYHNDEVKLHLAVVAAAIVGQNSGNATKNRAWVDV